MGLQIIPSLSDLLLPGKTVVCVCGDELPMDTPEQVKHSHRHQLACIEAEEAGPDTVGERNYLRQIEPLYQPLDPERNWWIKNRGLESVLGKKKS